MRFKGGIRKKLTLKEEQKENLDQRVYLESIVASMTDSLIVVNPDATLRLVNKAALDLLGYEKDELVGQPMERIFLQEEEKREEKNVLHKYFQEIIVAGVAYNIGLTFLTKEGKEIPINFSGATIEQKGKIIGIVGVARDMRQIMAVISDLEKKDRELEEHSKSLTRMQRAMLHMMNDLQEASRARAQFTGMVSHELRTPLAIIKEGVSVVLDKTIGNINKEQQKYLDIVKKNVDRLDRLISGVLDFQTLESGKMKFKMEQNDINEVAREIQQAMIPLAEKKNLDFVCQLDNDLPGAKFDRDKIIQVLTNLVNNAFKFTDKGSIAI
ncbi:MAG: PAS domain S-box protein, partial [Candidatus Omnitrophica bacterium]|nr:PAS domain S-box protein [Candidatus Omnitrophota bacterium]